MNTYMRQSLVPGSQTHPNFAKDKQAWENAIALYQGPDPLDHWWNFLSWYENNRQADPDNKFRETLERCLTLYEHSEYYKHDIRMVQLWLKYIDMQNNPLHFYQVLHQRGVGTQLACFYISWANYYESLQAFKEVEAVYNLAFQEKAQPYNDLHIAHSKFMYGRSMANNGAPQQHPAAISPHAPNHYQQQQQQQQSSHQQQQQPQPPPQPQNQHQHYLQQSQEQQSHHQSHIHPQHIVPENADYRNQVCYQANEGMTGTLPTASVYPADHLRYQNTYNHHSNQNYQQHLLEHSLYSTQQHPHSYQHQQDCQVNSSSVNFIHQNCDFVDHSSAASTLSVQVNGNVGKDSTNSQLANSAPECEQQEPELQQQEQDARERQELKSQSEASILNNERNHETTDAAPDADPTTNNDVVAQTAIETNETSMVTSNEVTGIRLPRRFVSYSSNNKETWQPALFLEEPSDPQRVCHYAKNVVYPPSTGMEYSPEEIKARRYKYHHPATLKHQMAEMISNNIQKNNIAHLYEQQQQQQQQQQTIFPKDIVNNINKKDALNATVGDQLKVPIEDGKSEQTSELAMQNKQRKDLTVVSNELDESEDNKNSQNEELDVKQATGKQRTISAKTLSNVGLEDIKGEVVAPPIRFTSTDCSQNKTIKIKFKKDRSIDGSESSNAYKIERIYQPELDTLSVPGPEKRNGGHINFHPYFSSSTPKTTTKRSKTKAKRINASRYSQTSASSVSSMNFPNNSNSNSSSVENGGVVASQTALKKNATPTSVQNVHFNDNANCAFASTVNLDSSNCSLTTAVDRLNFRDVAPLNNINSRKSTRSQIGGRNTSLNNTASNDLSWSGFQENSFFSTQHDTEAREKRLNKALETINCHLSNGIVVDPFSGELCRAFLTKLNFPGVDEQQANASYKIVQTPLPKIANTRQLNLCPGVQFNIDKEIGRGSYGSVYKATDQSTGTVMALKFQKPANIWEIYICDQVLKRLKSSSVLPGLMTISTAIIAPNASLIATEFSPFGSLLDINNKLRQATSKVMHESLVMHFSAQICDILYHLHKHHIIHADIKPDNFLLMRVPSTEMQCPSLRLIDFGCAIDMSLFPEGSKTKFKKVVQTDGFTCIEMIEGRTWSYETDFFCIAGTIHVMLFGEYMQLQKRPNAWDIKQKIPRYLKKHIWTDFFGQMLNIKPNGQELPDLNEMRRTFEEESRKMESELQKQIRTLSNLLHRR